MTCHPILICIRVFDDFLSEVYSCSRLGWCDFVGGGRGRIRVAVTDPLVREMPPLEFGKIKFKKVIKTTYT